MQIKNLQVFRSEWKIHQGYGHENWDENFIGTTHKETNGFYKMVNGIVGNIRADLTPKLQNAQDEQAIYEFLQNAADSKSTACAVIYDRSHLLILNNGKAFSNKDLQAILNTFQGTKADKGKPENCEKIGRYGVGFKLAYRLMGKSDGVNEILDQLSGPIIFSWNNQEDFEKLVQLDTKSKIELDDNISDENLAPWLVKIILACFPCVPNEIVKNKSYEDQVLFNFDEVLKLQKFLKQNYKLIKNLDLNSGSLFFLPFGPEKRNKLKESLNSIKSGIGYSLNTLKSLSKVILQDELIEKKAIEFENFTIVPGSAAFKKIDPEFPNCPVEIALGIPKNLEQAEQLKNTPSLYQFFPMRNERHNLAFFIHGTSFSKITDRTRLDSQGSANLATFNYIAANLSKRLNSYKKKDFKKFTSIYQALLLSDIPSQYNSELIKEHLYQPLLDYIRNQIPTHNNKTLTKDLVVIKNTKLNIEPITLGIGKEWFIWTDSSKLKPLQNEAANNAKLGLKRWSIVNLIQEGAPLLVNNWIQSLLDEEYQIFVEELGNAEIENDFLDHLAKLEIFKSTSSEDDISYISLDTLTKEEDLFVLDQATRPIKNVLKNLGFSIMEFDFNSDSLLFDIVKKQVPYLHDGAKTFDRIAKKIPESDLTPEQKQELFDVLSQLEGVSEESIKGLQLFSNQAGQTVSLFELIANDLETESWLDQFKVKREENSERLKSLSINQKQSNIYSNIIHPYWNDILPFIDHIEAPSFYESTIAYYSLKPRQKSLDTLDYIYIDREQRFQPQNAVFYHAKLQETAEEDYELLKNAVRTIFGLYLPDYRILQYLEKAPFRTPNIANNRDFKATLKAESIAKKAISLTFDERRILLHSLSFILNKKDLQNIPLFFNNLGQIESLNNLIDPGLDLPSWLEDYKLAKEEAHEELAVGLITEDQIFSQHLAIKWNTIIQHPSLTDDVESFYASCLFYDKLDKKNISLTNKSYIFSNSTQGFLDAKNCYYHQALNESDHYAELGEAIKLLTGKPIPQKAVLPFLQEKPFQTRDQLLSRSLVVDEVILNKKATLALLEFINKTRDDFFTFLYIEKQEDDSYKIGKKSNNIQYYSPGAKAQLHQSVKEYLGEHYRILPTEFYNPEFTNKGLQNEESIYQKLSRLAPSDKLSQIIAENDDVKAQAQMLRNMGKILLKEGASYSAGDFEYSITNFLDFEEADLQLLRKKIIIENKDGQQWSLGDVGYFPTITFLIDENRFGLPLIEMIPGLKEVYRLIDTITEQFNEIESSQELKKILFYGNREKPIDEVFRSMRGSSKILENAPQLAMVLLHAKTNNTKQQLNYFSVHTQEKPVKLSANKIFYLEDIAFIAQNVILSQKHYKGIERWLHWKKEKPSFSFLDQQLLKKPYLDITSNTFVSPFLKKEEEEEKTQLQNLVISYVKGEWNKGQIPSFSFFTNDKDSSLYGFQPKEHVYSAGYNIMEEQVPNTILEALDPEEDPLSFFKAIGINTDESELVSIRKHLNGEKDLEQEDVTILLRELSNKAIENTIVWLKEQGIEISDNSSSMNTMKLLYSKIDKTLNLPILHKANKQSLTFKVSSVEDMDLYFFDDEIIAQLKGKYNYPVKSLISSIKKSGSKITNIQVKGIPITPLTIHQELNLEELEANSEEWTEDYYLQWKENSTWEIFLFEKEMPYRVHIMEQVATEHYEGFSIIDGKRIYVSKLAPNIEEILFELSNQKNSFKEIELLSLLRFKNQKINVDHSSLSEQKSDETILSNLGLAQVKDWKEKGQEGKIILEFDLKDFSSDAFEEIFKLAKDVRLKVNDKDQNQ